MKQYTVAWRDAAVDELMEIWLAASDRQAVTAAADAIDQILAAAPSDEGRMLAEELWVLHIQPLRVYFRVSEADRMVWVDKVVLRQ